MEKLIEDLKELFIDMGIVASADYGTQEEFSVSKRGVKYMRAHIELIDADDYFIRLKLIVTDMKIKYTTDAPVFDNRLKLQDRTLLAIRKMVKAIKVVGWMPNGDEHTYEPTGLYMEDQSEGWSTEIEMRLDGINICKED